MSSASGENRLIDWLRRRPGAELVGNDAAVLPPGPFAVTVDHQIAGVHFPPDLDPARIAKRLLAVNLSDLAAMGATPAYAFLALAAPEGFDHRRFFESLLDACARHEMKLAGGDLAKNPERLVASLTLMGTREEGSRWLERSGARPGHDLWLGGTVGESALGRGLLDRGASENLEAFPSSLRAPIRRAIKRHLEPTPQLELGRWLARTGEGAAMDVSDGVARDLHSLCKASGVGAEVYAESLPFSDRFVAICKTIDVDPLALALGGGEDYVLLFTLPPGPEPPFEGARRIGSITEAGRGLTLLRAGRRSPLPDAGWDHLTGPQ